MTTSRIIGVDVARALALLGMVAAHMIDAQPNASDAIDGWFQVVSGRSSALFAVLAGVSIALSTTSGRSVPLTLRSGARTALATRAGLVALIGLLLGPLSVGVAVILTYYGVLFLCALPVLRWRARALALLALGWALLSPVASMVARPYLPAPTYEMPSPIFLTDPGQLASELLVTGYYPVLTWATYLFAGMAIGRLDLRSPALARRLLRWGLCIAVLAWGLSALLTRIPRVQQDLLRDYDGVGSPSNWEELSGQMTRGFFGTTPTEPWWWLGLWAPHSGSVADLAQTTGSAMAVLGVALLATSALTPPARRVVAVTFGAGTMTLTLYVTHVVLLAAPTGILWSDRIGFHVVILGSLGALGMALRSRGPLELLVSEVSLLASNRSTKVRDHSHP